MIHAEALSSLIESPNSHAWTAIGSNHASLALTPTWTSVYLLALKGDSVILLRIPLEKDEDEDDDEDDDDEKAQKVNVSTEPQVVLNIAQHFPSVKEAGVITVSREGHIFWMTADGVLVADPEKIMVFGVIPTPSEPISITLGADGFLYVSTMTNLLRIRV